MLPVGPNNGFRQAGWFIWCGSLIESGGHFHLFAARWPESTGFPNGYRDHSEIVRAEAPAPEGPYAFREIVLRGRGGSFWDGKMCSNPIEIIARDISPGIKIEDPDLGFRNGQFEMLVEDNVGGLTGHARHGALLISRDGLHWEKSPFLHAYTHRVECTDGRVLDVERRERPECFAPGNKGLAEPTHLLTGVLHEGKTWNLIQRIAPADGMLREMESGE